MTKTHFVLVWNQDNSPRRQMIRLANCPVQGRSKGGYMGIYTPKSVQVDFLWGRNDVKTAIEHEY